jgi:hypothetical protein
MYMWPKIRTNKLGLFDPLMADMFKVLLPIIILSSTYSANYCLNIIEVKLTYLENSDFCLNSSINVCEISIKTL